jgi:hypothetical protein
VDFLQRSSSKQNQELSAIASFGLKPSAPIEELRAILSTQEEAPANPCQSHVHPQDQGSFDNRQGKSRPSGKVAGKDVFPPGVASGSDLASKKAELCEFLLQLWRTAGSEKRGPNLESYARLHHREIWDFFSVRRKL